MIGFLLDTNILSELVRPRPEPRVSQHCQYRGIAQRDYEDAAGRKKIAARCLADRALSLHTFQGRVLPLTQAIAERWGLLAAQREIKGRPLHVPDGQIAATALELDLTLVTRIAKDFEGLGLTILNPWESA